MRKLWVDDSRPAPEGWELARSFHEACTILEKQEHDEISLDHDLGLGSQYGAMKEMTGMDILNWLEFRFHNALVIPNTIRIHTANSAARAKMVALAVKLMEAQSADTKSSL